MQTCNPPGTAPTWLFKIQKIFPSLFYLFINLYIFIYCLQQQQVIWNNYFKDKR